MMSQPMREVDVGAEPEWEDVGDATATDDESGDESGGVEAPMDDLTELILALKCRA